MHWHGCSAPALCIPSLPFSCLSSLPSVPCHRHTLLSIPLGSASALTSVLLWLPSFPVLSRAVLAAGLERRQQWCHLRQEASPIPPVPALLLLGHWDGSLCTCLGQASPAAAAPGAQEVWGHRGDRPGQQDTRGQQEPAPRCRGSGPTAPALLGTPQASTWPGRTGQVGCQEVLCSAP